MDLRLGVAPAPKNWRAPDDTRFLCLSWEHYASLQALGMESRADACEDHFPEARAKDVLAETERLADGWRLMDGRDFTEFEGVSLGRCWRWLLWVTEVLPAYKFLVSMQAAIARFKPGRIICETAAIPAQREVLNALAQGAPWRLEWEERSWNSALNHRWSPPRYELSAPKRAAVGIFNSAARWVGPNGRRPLVLSYYHALHAATRRLARRDSPLRLMLADAPARDLLPRLLASGAEILERTRRSPSPDATRQDALDRIRRAWNVAKARLGNFYLCHGVSLRRALEPAIDRLLGEPAEQLAWTVSQYRRLWTEEKPAAVLLPYEEPPYQAMLSEIARLERTPCATYLHGLPERYRLPFVQNSSSHFLVWGPRMIEEYRANGVIERRMCLAVGNPQFDHFVGPPPEPPRVLCRVLVLTYPSPSGIWMDSNLEPERHATRLADIFSSFPTLQVTLKLHPSESLEYYRELLSPWAGRLRLERDKPLTGCLRECDLVVGSFSTALIEAMLLNRPILLLHWTRTVYHPPFDAHWGMRELRTPEALRETLADILRDPAPRLEALTKHYPRILDAFVGPRDGHAARRLAEAVATMATQEA